MLGTLSCINTVIPSIGLLIFEKSYPEPVISDTEIQGLSV